jgi:CRISPR-associated protein Cas5t
VTAPRALFLRLDAPFAAWRWLQAGVYRATFPVIPHSAAWGLALNLAGIETRGDLSNVVTPIRSDAPHLDVAVGLERRGDRATLYQQLHGYPVGAEAGRQFKVRAYGRKYQIAPVRRELLVGQVAVIGIRGECNIVDRIPSGLVGSLDIPRYGLPFAGDNQLLFSSIEVVPESTLASWYVPVAAGEQARESTRLTTNIDRADASRTWAPLFAPTSETACPEAAWVRVGPASISRA